MKRLVILLGVAFLLVGASVFAETSTLIDFGQLTADSNEGENAATLLDFSDTAGSSFSEEEKAQMVTSLFIENWGVTLASSSRTVENQSQSYARAVPVKDSAAQFAGETVLGVRVHFPEAPFNSFAIIEPPFEIPAYMRADENDLTGSKFDGYGVVKNVGVLKSLSVNVYGRNFPNGLEVVLLDQNNEEQRIFLGYLDFDGWKTITWENPNYITEVRNREISNFALYPNLTPMVKLDSIVVYRDANQPGGDFIGYIKDIAITYDKAVLELESDIDEEAIWGILQEREESRRNAEFQRLGNLQVLRYLEEQKMHQEE